MPTEKMELVYTPFQSPSKHNYELSSPIGSRGAGGAVWAGHECYSLAPVLEEQSAT